MNNEEVRQWLDVEWTRILGEEDSAPDPEIDQFINSSIVSIRYACVTQLLGKIADHSRHLLSLQASDSHPGAWDARSFSKLVIVPWVTANHAVLGMSGEPYASKPLRRPSLADVSNVKNKEEWQGFVRFLQDLENADQSKLQHAFKRCLQSIARKLKKQKFDYPIPRRMSLGRVSLILTSFLQEASQGLRPLVVSAALLRVLGEAFSLFSEIKAQGLNEADTPSGMPGDIMCYDANGKMMLVVEVKDRDLTLLDLRHSVSKALQTEGISRLLFAVPGVDEQNRSEIETRIEREWASGLNVYHVDVQTLAKTAFTLLDEEWHVTFLQEVGKELDARGVHTHREKWRQLLIGDRE